MQNKVDTGLVERYFRLGFSLLILLGLFSCAAQHQARWDPLQQSDDHSSGLDASYGQLSPAIQRLLQQADQAIISYDWHKAISILERALTINPKQAETWSRLSVANYGKQEYRQSVQMARRSNSHISSNPELKAYNWLMIARAYEQLGDWPKSQQARETYQQLRDRY